MADNCRAKILSGELTQLVECLLCKQDVTGSSPVFSTKGSLHRRDFRIDNKHNSSIHGEKT